MAQNDFRRQQFVDAAAIVAREIAERFYDNRLFSVPTIPQFTIPALPADEPEWLASGDAAKKFRVHRSTLKRWADEGQLQRTGEGRLTRYNADDIKRLMRTKKRE